jgi:hypothetical protein
MSTLSKRAPPATALTLPSALDLDADDQITSGAFYKNGSDFVLILGGRYTSGGCTNVGLYSTKSNQLSPLNSSVTIDGIVLALKVVDDSLLIGGNFTSSQSNSAGLAMYNLESNSWSDSPPGLVGKCRLAGRTRR